MVKNPPANAGDMGSFPGSGRSPGGGNGNSLQYSCLGNPWTEQPCGLQSMRSQRAGHDSVTEHEHTCYLCISFNPYNHTDTSILLLPPFNR